MSAEIRSLPVGKQLRRARDEDSHPVPDIRLPRNWERNEPMCNDARTEVGLRRGDWECFIEIRSVSPLARVEGPYYLEALEHIGGDDSLETRLVERKTGVEPGAVQEAVISLVLLLAERGRQPTVTDGGGELREEILAELEQHGPAGVGAVILSARVGRSLNETVEALDELTSNGEVDEMKKPSKGGRYRLAIEPAGVSHD